jgi:hypothetical protein
MKKNSLLILLVATVACCSLHSKNKQQVESEYRCLYVKSKSFYNPIEYQRIILKQKYNCLEFGNDLEWAFDTITNFPLKKSIIKIDGYSCGLSDKGLIFLNQFINLKNLDISNNNILNLSYLPKIDSLLDLDMSYNKDIDLSIFFTNYKNSNIEVLDLSSCNLSVLPKEICNLINLEYLAISDNHLKKLPECLCNLRELKYILADDNDSLIISDELRKGRLIEPLKN